MSKAPVEIRSLARSHTEKALKTLVAIMENSEHPPAARVAAANSLLDRGWGKAEVRVEAEVAHRYVARVPDKAKTTEEWQRQHEQRTIQ